ARQSKKVRWWDITWRPARLTSTFHGRDLFAPVAARLGLGHSPEEIGCRPLARGIPDVPADWPRIIYIDWFGNLMTGMRASRLSHEHVLSIGGYLLKRADTFSDVEEGEPFWYENSIGLVEIAVNQDAADEILELDIGDPLEPQPVPHRR
ncbi:MAG: SAM-dependent chlorinase/fluorinase, partial [Gammaproteobacteria bacterium]